MEEEEEEDDPCLTVALVGVPVEEGSIQVSVSLHQT